MCGFLTLKQKYGFPLTYKIYKIMELLFILCVKFKRKVKNIMYLIISTYLEESIKIQKFQAN